MKSTLLFLICSTALAQTGPWNNPLMMATSTDGRFFSTPSTFQDSSGVPSAIRWKGDTLVCAFQWFRQPIGSATWDRVAVKFSYDDGLSWTTPVPIVIDALPAGYQRPFDPTLVVTSGDSFRIYFSSSAGMPGPGQDSMINTYSAIGADGIHYRFEPGPRVDHPIRRVIDPAVIFFNGMWHYSSPIGAPQEGAFHYTSPDGLVFQQQANQPSDNMHNWTGNYVVDGSLLRFYGSGPQIWYNTSADGFSWSGYLSTNVQGGDPTVVRRSATNYLMIFVGPPYQTGVELQDGGELFVLLDNVPNPFNPATVIRYRTPQACRVTLKIYDLMGREIEVLVAETVSAGMHEARWDASGFGSGVYFYEITAGEFRQVKRMMMMK